MELAADLERIAAAAAGLAEDGALVAVLAAEAVPGLRRYVCAFEADGGRRSWLALDEQGRPVTSRRDVRDAVSIAALCEVAGESAFPGDLDGLRPALVAEAEEAARALRQEVGTPPQLATPARLDRIGAAARRLELALDPLAGSPFTAALKGAQRAVDELLREVEDGYRAALE